MSHVFVKGRDLHIATLLGYNYIRCVAVQYLPFHTYNRTASFKVDPAVRMISAVCHAGYTFFGTGGLT